MAATIEVATPRNESSSRSLNIEITILLRKIGIDYEAQICIEEMQTEIAESALAATIKVTPAKKRIRFSDPSNLKRYHHSLLTIDEIIDKEIL